MLKWFHKIFWQPINNEKGNTIGQAILGVVGLAVTFIPGVNIAWYLGLGIGLTLGGILFPPDIESPKTEHSNLQFQTSQYGIPIPVVYGSRKLAGNLIWYGDFQTHEHEEEAGGKGGGGSSYTTYTYSVGLAFGVCMAPAGDRKNIINVWAGKDLVDPSKYRVYDGSQITPDSYIAGFTTRDPVWKNLCYIVFEDYDLGNNSMIPNFTFEIEIQRSYYSEFGSDGSGDGQFHYPYGMDADSNYIYIADTANHRIQIFNKTSPYSFVGKFGSSGSGNGQFSYPNDVAVDSNYIYVPDSSNNRIQIFDKVSPYGYVGQFGSSGNGNGQFNEPYGIFVDSNYIYVADTYNYRIQIFDKVSPYGYVGQFGSSGNGNGQFSTPYDLFVDANRIYVTDSSNDRIQIFNKTSPYSFVGKFGSSGSGNGQFDYPYGIFVDSDFIYVTDWANSRVQIFDRLTYAYKYELKEWTGDQFSQGPYGIFVDNNFIYVVDTLESRVVIFSKSTTFDVTPPAISNNILTNDLYGLGLNPAYLNSDIFTATGAYCTANDLLVSMIFDRQISVLDALQYIIQHHNGYITYFDGLIAHNQLETEVPVMTLTTDYIVQEGNKYPVQIVKAGGRDYNNKIMVQWTKRANDYVTGIAQVDDMLDIETYGLKDATVPLDGLCIHSRASKMANLLLKKSLKNPESLTFKVGPKSIGLKPGDVYAITDAGVELNAKGIRIQTISETNDYQIEVNAKEELDTYTYLQTGDDTTTLPTLPDLSGDPGNVLTPMAIEVPALYSGSKCQVSINYSKSGDTSWAGASLYKAYSATGSYIAKGSRTGSGITGRISAIGETGADRYIDVILNWDATLVSATSFDDLMITPMKNLMVIETTTGDIYLRYQTVTLTGTNTWRLTGLIYDLTGTPLLNTYGVIAVNDDIVIYNNVNFLLDLEEIDKYKTIYFKVPSYNFKGEEESLAIITAINEIIDVLCDKPLPPFDFKLNDEIGLHSTSVSIKAGDIKVDWISANRFNTGAPDFDRFGVVTEDTDFKDFLIEIYNSTTLKRSTTSTSKTFTYSTTDQVADSAVSPFIFKIKQRNLSYIESTYDAITINTV